MARVVPAYRGPECPRCAMPLGDSQRQSGTITCRACGKEFEATAFEPPVRPARQAQTVDGAGPDGATACATHSGNAAVTSCSRCGLFICSLCEMTIATGTYCPSCFDRIRTEGTQPEVVTRHRDYVSIARLALFTGIVYVFLPFTGAFALYSAIKGIKQRREEGRSPTGAIIIAIFAVAEVIGGLALYGFMFWAIFGIGRGAK